MPDAIAPFYSFERFSPFELMRSALVYGCALALIVAGPFLPAFAL